MNLNTGNRIAMAIAVSIIILVFVLGFMAGRHTFVSSARVSIMHDTVYMTVDGHTYAFYADEWDQRDLYDLRKNGSLGSQAF